MSLQSTVRSWLVASASSSSRALQRRTLNRSIRYIGTTHEAAPEDYVAPLENDTDFDHFEDLPEHPVVSIGKAPEGPLEHPDDWTDLQLRRAHVEFLIKDMSKYGSTQGPDNTYKPRDALHKPTAQPTISALLASGAHFGHAASRMNPNFMPYAYGTRAGITVIDLDQTLPMLRRAANVVRAIASAGGQIVFIGTRPDLRPIVQKAAQRLGSQGFSVGDRWLPGTLTNKIPLFGLDVIKSTKVTPDLVILLNPLANVNAIRECAIEHVPTIALVDSNVDPRIVMYPIPANDESTRTAELVGGILSIAGREGVAIYNAEQARHQNREGKWENPRYGGQGN